MGVLLQRFCLILRENGNAMRISLDMSLSDLVLQHF